MPLLRLQNETVMEACARVFTVVVGWLAVRGTLG
jgi:hypothetical protein